VSPPLPKKKHQQPTKQSPKTNKKKPIISDTKNTQLEEYDRKIYSFLKGSGTVLTVAAKGRAGKGGSLTEGLDKNQKNGDFFQGRLKCGGVIKKKKNSDFHSSSLRIPRENEPWGVFGGPNTDRIGHRG